LGTVSVFDRINTAAVNFDKAGFDPGLSSGGGSTVQVRSKSVEGVNHSYMGIDPVFLKFGGELNLGKYGTLNGGLRKTYLAGLLKSLSDSFYVSPLVRDYFLKYTLNISKQQQLSASVLEATDQVESFERSGKKLDNGTPVTQDRFQQVGVRSMLWQAGLMQASKNGGWSEWQGYHSSYYFQNQLSLTTYLGQQQTLDQKSIRSYRMGMSESGLKFKKTTSPGYNRQFYWGGQVFYRFFRPGQRVNAQMAAGLPNTDTTYFNVTASVTELAGFIGSGRKYKQLGLLEYSSRVALL
jgi:hypothetical protein